MQCLFSGQCNSQMASGLQDVCMEPTCQSKLSPTGTSSTAKPVKLRYQTVKVGAPQGTGQTCSCMDLVLIEFGFSLRGIHCRNSLYIFIFPLPVCVALCLPEQLATAGVSRVVDTRALSWVSQRHSEQTLVIPCDFCFCRLQDSLCGVGVCCPVHS